MFLERTGTDLLINPGKLEESQDSFQYPLEGYKYLETDYFLVKNKKTICKVLTPVNGK